MPICAYPLWAAGTFASFVEICLCGWAVESSSQKLTVTVQCRAENQCQIIFLQQEIPEQSFPSYMIKPINPGGKMLVSKRLWPPTTEPDSEVPNLLADIWSFPACDITRPRDDFRPGWVRVPEHRNKRTSPIGRNLPSPCGPFSIIFARLSSAKCWRIPQRWSEHSKTREGFGG